MNEKKFRKRGNETSYERYFDIDLDITRDTSPIFASRKSRISQYSESMVVHGCDLYMPVVVRIIETKEMVSGGIPAL